MGASIRKWVVMGAGLCLLLGGTELVRGQPPQPLPGPDIQPRTEIHRITTIIQSKVVVRPNIQVAHVVDVVLNDHGCAEFLVVAHEDKHWMVPWAAAHINFNKQIVRLDITRDRFIQLPTFARGRWPTLDAQYRQRIMQGFNVKVIRPVHGQIGDKNPPPVGKNPPLVVASPWHYQDGYWMYQSPDDNRWYFTDGRQWYFKQDNRWLPYRFDAKFGRDFRRTAPVGTVTPLDNQWQVRDGYWTYRSRDDNRWYYTDGRNWYYQQDTQWQPYRFDARFGVDFRRQGYTIPGRPGVGGRR